MNLNMRYTEGLVSIITPMYNAEKWIEKTIQSVLKQTYGQWEMIIVDDCSNDHSADVVKSYAESDVRIKYFLNQKNSGVAKTRNAAISFAKGQYLAFLDSDDIWYPEKLEKQIQKMKNEKAAFCYSGCGIIDENDYATGKVRRVPTSLSFKELLKGNEIPCLTVVIDRRIVDNIYMPSIRHEDYACWLDILKTGIIAYGINEPLADYRVCSNSLSGNKWKVMGWTWSLYRNYLQLGLLKSGYYFIWYIIKSLKKRM